MHITEHFNTHPLKITSSNNQGQNNHGKSELQDSEAVLQSDTLTLSDEGKLKAKTEQQNEQPEVPPHIQRILEQIKKLKQELAKLKQELAEIAQNTQLSEEQRMTLMAQRQSMVSSLQGALQLASTALHEALNGTSSR